MRPSRRRPPRTLLRVLLWTGGLLALAGVGLWIAGVRVLPDERYSWERQARDLAAVNDRLEALALDRPTGLQHDALFDAWSEVEPSKETIAWWEAARSALGEARAIYEDVIDTKYELSASRADLQWEMSRFGRALRELLPHVDWSRIEMAAHLRALTER